MLNFLPSPWNTLTWQTIIIKFHIESNECHWYQRLHIISCNYNLYLWGNGFSYACFELTILKCQRMKWCHVKSTEIKNKQNLEWILGWWKCHEVVSRQMSLTKYIISWIVMYDSNDWLEAAAINRIQIYWEKKMNFVWNKK